MASSLPRRLVFSPTVYGQSTRYVAQSIQYGSENNNYLVSPENCIISEESGAPGGYKIRK